MAVIQQSLLSAHSGLGATEVFPTAVEDNDIQPSSHRARTSNTHICTFAHRIHTHSDSVLSHRFYFTHTELGYRGRSSFKFTRQNARHTPLHPVRNTGIADSEEKVRSLKGNRYNCVTDSNSGTEEKKFSNLTSKIFDILLIRLEKKH